jgi:hypothetical protein
MVNVTPEAGENVDVTPGLMVIGALPVEKFAVSAKVPS